MQLKSFVVNKFKGIVSVIILCLTIIGCNKKYYDRVANAKDDDNSKFVILKSGEKIEIKAAKMHFSTGTIVSIDKGEKDFKKSDVLAVQNNTGFYKKFPFAFRKNIFLENQVVKNGPIDGENFAERTNKGAINIYMFMASSSLTERTKIESSINYFHVIELNSSKEAIIFDETLKENEIDIFKSWISNSESATNIISDWEKLSANKKRNSGADIFKKAAIKYNEDFIAGKLKS